MAKRSLHKRANDSQGISRIPIIEEVRIQCEDWNQFRIEHAENISEGGIFIKTSNPLSPGTVFNLSICVGGEEFQAKAQVTWTKEFSTEPDRVSGMGARFIKLDSKSKKKIRALIEEQIK